MGSRSISGLQVLVIAVLVFSAAAAVAAASSFSSTCSQIECPPYQLLYNGDFFSIRLYNSSVWMATSAIQDTSFVNATRTGFLRLFDYIQGANEGGVSINMTAPVLTGIIPSVGPFCMSSFIVRFYVPDAYQEDPPTPNEELELSVDRWSGRYYAVRTFGGFVTDSNVAIQAATLEASLYEAGYTVASASSDEESYVIAQYNSPFEFSGRVNEVWLPLSLDSTSAIKTISH